MSIRVLDSETINRIAAGEVIERPASIVKELTENAIDAGASAVTIEIRDGGQSLIRVTDNGCGIPKEEVRSAFLRHATSKIRTAEDLTGVRSLGFRGEALSSIAAVCRTEIITKTAAALTGTRCVIEGGEEKVFEEIGAPEGTTLIARDIFFHTPVRRKFLKSAATEGAHVAELAEQLALSHPEVSVRLIVNGQSRFGTSGNGAVKDIIYQLYGRNIAGHLIEVDAEEEGFSVRGFIGKPEVSRGSRALEHYCINGRYIRSSVIARAIEDGFGNRMMQHSFPFTMLFISVDPARVDVNVHPTKREVRFSDSQSLYLFLKDAVAESLNRTELIRSMELPVQRGASSAVASHSASGNGEERRKTAGERTARPAEPFEVQRAAAQRGERLSSAAHAQNVTQRQTDAQTQSASLSDFISAYGKEPTAETRVAGEPATGAQCDNPQDGSARDGRGQDEIARHGNARQSCTAEVQTAHAEERPVSSGYERGETVTLREPAGEFDTVSRHGQYAFLSPQQRNKVRIVGDVFDTYWIAEWNGALYIIDQHAAHEKVNYERFLAAYQERSVSAQSLMPPLIITLTDREAALLSEHEALFRSMGYEIEHFGGHEYTVRAVPDILPSVMKDELLKTMIGSLSEETGAGLPRLILEKTASMSCKAAVKGNQKLSTGEAEKLLDELFALRDPYNCPHGRPTVIRLTKAELERRFKRIL